MAIAHVCVQCGWDLARVRPQREPHYGLYLVHCPKCEAVAVRRRHPVTAGWRGIRRLDFAMTMMMLRLVGLATLTFFCTLGSMLAVAIIGEWRSPAAHHWPDETVAFVLFFFLLVPVVLGTFLTAAFEHIPRGKMWLGWLAWMAFVLMVVSVHGPMGDEFDPRSHADLERGGVLQWVGRGWLHIALPSTAVVGIMLIVALPGLIVGRWLLRLRDVLIRAKWRWRRRRLRLAGAANV